MFWGGTGGCKPRGRHLECERCRAEKGGGSGASRNSKTGDWDKGIVRAKQQRQKTRNNFRGEGRAYNSGASVQREWGGWALCHPKHRERGRHGSLASSLHSSAANHRETDSGDRGVGSAAGWAVGGCMQRHATAARRPMLPPLSAPAGSCRCACCLCRCVPGWGPLCPRPCSCCTPCARCRCTCCTRHRRRSSESTSTPPRPTHRRSRTHAAAPPLPAPAGCEVGRKGTLREVGGSRTVCKGAGHTSRVCGIAAPVQQTLSASCPDSAHRPQARACASAPHLLLAHEDADRHHAHHAPSSRDCQLQQRRGARCKRRRRSGWL